MIRRALPSVIDPRQLACNMRREFTTKEMMRRAVFHDHVHLPAHYMLNVADNCSTAIPKPLGPCQLHARLRRLIVLLSGLPELPSASTGSDGHRHCPASARHIKPRLSVHFILLLAHKTLTIGYRGPESFVSELSVVVSMSPPSEAMSDDYWAISSDFPMDDNSDNSDIYGKNDQMQEKGSC